jgi:hypothetical protein
MKCHPQVFVSKCRLVYARSGVIIGIHSVVTHHSTKLSHPSQSLVVATNGMSWLFTWQQVSMERLPLDTRYNLTVEATLILAKVLYHLIITLPNTERTI